MAVPSAVARLVPFALALVVGGCDLFTSVASDPVGPYRGDWRIDVVETQEFASDGTVTRDERLRDLGTLRIAVQTVDGPFGTTITEDAASGPPSFAALFRPFERLGEAGALRAYPDGTVGSGVSAIELRLVFDGIGLSNQNGFVQTDFSYVATATLDGDLLTMLYVERGHGGGTFGMSYRQEVRLARTGPAD
ncbi:MAG: hypothetical protein AAGK21_08670 [Bacteroidota bacterium]